MHEFQHVQFKNCTGDMQKPGKNEARMEGGVGFVDPMG